MRDLIIDENIEVSNVRYEIERINYFNNKIIPYNGKSIYPLHKFWIHIDKCKIVRRNFFNDSQSITVGLPLESKTIKNVKLVEKTINSKLLEDEITRFSIISKLNDSQSNIPTFELTVCNDSIIFDENNSKLNTHIDFLKLHDELQIIAELDFVTSNDNYLKANWKIVQAMHIKSIDLTTPLFSMISSHNNKNINVNNVNKIFHLSQNDSLQNNSLQNYENKIQHNLPLESLSQNNISKQNTYNTQNSIQTSKKPVFIIPSTQDLANALSGLKKIKNTTTNQKPNITTEKIQNENHKLKHVVTKESNIYEMLRNEYLIKQKFETEIQSLNKLDYLRNKLTKYYKRSFREITENYKNCHS